MKLYSFAGSCALATHIALEWIGKPYNLKMIQKAELSTPEMLKLNPNHQVPILDDGGWVLVENAAILNYLADKFPEAKLGGDGTSRGRAEVNRWLAMLNSDVHPAFKPLFGATDYLEDATMIEKSHANARKVLRKYFEEFNEQLGKHDYIAGARSIADPYLFVVLRWARGVKVDLSGLDNLRKFEQRMRTDAGVQRALKAQGLDQAKAA
ncbi:MAG TPA: glutathione S-transferase N-terminal domain-containing protein [Rhodanobacteraceae bacterium]|nr:glutathione S-transferase N-terminal domain-containing protein [Rhodanobacteraceae bacterium]